jgi:hypothetical protein
MRRAAWIVGWPAAMRHAAPTRCRGRPAPRRRPPHVRGWSSSCTLDLI